MATYDVTITNGQGSQLMKAGTYTVSATSAPGYDLSTLTPTNYTAPTTAATGTFTLSANGTLTFVVNETGASGGTPVTSGTIVMTDSTGNTQYGSAVTINSNVPYGSSETPYTLYFKQLTTDETHNIYEGVITVSMASQNQTEYLLNSPIAEQTFDLTDANYSGLPINSATLNFTNE